MINFREVDLSYNNKKIFKQLSLKVEKGDKVAILGKSGVGKSSLFHLILGFANPQKGEVFFEDVRIDEKTVWDIRKKIAFVDQDVSIGEGKSINWIKSVFDLQANYTKDFPLKEMKQLFDYFELSEDELDKNIEDLSGGERQRLAIIASILLKREIFLFDEITSALDSKLKGKVVDYFTQHKQWTVVVISHDSAWLNHRQVKVFNLKEKVWEQ